jgi:hypothetical protein
MVVVAGIVAGGVAEEGATAGAEDFEQAAAAKATGAASALVFTSSGRIMSLLPTDAPYGSAR